MFFFHNIYLLYSSSILWRDFVNWQPNSWIWVFILCFVHWLFIYSWCLVLFYQHLILLRVQILKKRWVCKMIQPLWKIPYKVQRIVTIQSSSITPRYLPRWFKAYAHTQTCMPIFIATLPIITIKIGNKQYVLLNVPYHKLWYIHKTYTIWWQKGLSDLLINDNMGKSSCIFLSERSQ